MTDLNIRVRPGVPRPMLVTVEWDRLPEAATYTVTVNGAPHSAPTSYPAGRSGDGPLSIALSPAPGTVVKVVAYAVRPAAEAEVAL